MAQRIDSPVDFRYFASINVFDIEISERDPDRIVEIIASLETSFGGINLDDIKAPECLHSERPLRNRMKIPVFHADQRGIDPSPSCHFVASDQRYPH